MTVHHARNDSILFALFQTVQILLVHGADPNAKDVHHVGGLVWAAGRGHEDVVGLMLDAHAKVDQADKYGTTALVWAARRGHRDIVRRLLDAGASVDAVGMYSWTPLLVATKCVTIHRQGGKHEI